VQAARVALVDDNGEAIDRAVNEIRRATPGADVFGVVAERLDQSQRKSIPHVTSVLAAAARTLSERIGGKKNKQPATGAGKARTASLVRD
jgi:hypothetical protein